MLTKVEGFQIDHNAIKAAVFTALSDRLTAMKARSTPDNYNETEVHEAITSAIDLVRSDDWATMPSPPSKVLDGMIAATEVSRELGEKYTIFPSAAAGNGKQQLYIDNLEIASSIARLLGQTVIDTSDLLHLLGSHPRIQSTANVVTVSTSAIGTMALILALFGLW